MAPERPAVVGGRRRAVGEALAGGPGTAEVDPRERRPTLVRSQPRWPLSAHVVRQIRRQVARDGRSLQRLEVQGAVIDNFDALGPLSPPSPRRRPSVGREPERRDADDAPGEDGDLTSLTWLQDRNLLRSINLSKGESDELRPAAARTSPRASPPGLGREVAAPRRSGGSRSRSGASGASPTSDYLEDSFTSEPADSSSSDQPPASPCASPPPRGLAEPPAPDGPADSPGANGPASKAKHPHNVPYDPLVHVQNKPPYSFSCLIFMAIEDSPKKALPVKDIYSWILEHFPYFRSAPTGWKNSVRHNLSLNKCFLKVEKVQSLGKGSLWMVDDHYRSNLVQAFSRSPFHPCCPTPRSPSPSASPSRPASPRDSEDRVPNAETNGIKGAPNPELFPFLSRHLAASANGTPSDGPPEALSDHDSCDSSDEVVAAAMVLALKHGPGVLPPPLISSCPTQDHTYSSAATGSPEAGYGSDEEQRRTAEALLHLAGLPPAPELQSEMAHRPRLLRRAPKRPAQSFIANNGSPHHHAINNNCGNQADRNLLRVKRSRQHHL